MTRACTLVILFVLIGCASQPQKIAITPSGRPEVTISTADRSAVRHNIISNNVLIGWTLQQESDSTIVFHRPFDDTTLLLGSALLGNRVMRQGMSIRYTIVQAQGGVRVFVTPFNDASAVEFNVLQTQLQTVKREIEGR